MLRVEVSGYSTRKGSPWWPTRLLQIQEQDSSGLRLIETTESAPKGPYLTLSHRWGKAQFKKLTAKTLDDLKAGISVAILPKTFQDAISVARRLQVRYLWIDSLCIMQDSSEDWNREASQMSLVYQHGYCNIAATGALDSTAGLFLDGSAPLQTPCRVELPMWGDPQGREVSYVLDPDLWRNRIDNAPLITRAWVERFLAKRVLHFTKDQLFWECRERMACEAFPVQMFSPGSTTQFKNIIPRNRTSRNYFEGEYLSISKHGRHSIDSRECVWANILRCYTAANLTNSEDKGVALSGIIKVLEGPKSSRDTKPPYCAPSWSCKSLAAFSFSSLSFVIYLLTHLRAIYK
ncbi:Heterokaryon incompatibility protein (HET) domain containing protein [Hyaloscypha variabilis]